jgi:hypothetical protein
MKKHKIKKLKKHIFSIHRTATSTHFSYRVLGPVGPLRPLQSRNGFHPVPVNLVAARNPAVTWQS